MSVICKCVPSSVPQYMPFVLSPCILVSKMQGVCTGFWSLWSVVGQSAAVVPFNNSCWWILFGCSHSLVAFGICVWRIETLQMYIDNTNFHSPCRVCCADNVRRQNVCLEHHSRGIDPLIMSDRSLSLRIVESFLSWTCDSETGAETRF